VFYLIAIIGILYLFSKRGTSNATVLPVVQSDNVVTSSVRGAALYIPTANGTMGKVTPGPTSQYGTLGIAQTAQAIAVVPVPNPAMSVYEPSDALEFATAKIMAGEPDMQPVARARYY
jgi:hypothetical protein